MNINLDSYRSIAQGASLESAANKTVHLSKSKNALVLRGGGFIGRLVSWFKGYDKQSRNIEVRNHFIRSLTSHYGKGAVSNLVRKWRGNNEVHGKTLLTAREVREAFDKVEASFGEISEHNYQITRKYSHSPLADKKHSSLRAVLEEKVFSGKEVPKEERDKVDRILYDSKVAHKISARIKEKSDNNKHRVGDGEAAHIAEQVLREVLAEGGYRLPDYKSTAV